jgi:hypothetical protein
MRSITSSLIAAAAALCIAADAQAVTLTQSLTLPAPIGPNPVATSTVGIVGQNVTTNIRGYRRSPWFRTPYMGAEFSSVQRNAVAIWDFAEDQVGMSMLWGSVDSFNQVRFFDDGVLVHVLTGSDLFPTVQPGSGFSVIGVSNIRFDRMRFSSSRNAFEFANLQTTEIPLPGGFLLLLPALGGLALLARRRPGPAKV